MADAYTSKLSRVVVWTNTFYGLDLCTKILFEWKDVGGTVTHTCEQAAIEFDATTVGEERIITGEVGTVYIYLAGSDQIQGIKLVETDTTTYVQTETLLGSESQGNPKEIHLNGPIVGFSITYQLDIDSLQFWIDSTYCYRSAINAFQLADVGVQLGYIDTIAWTDTAYSFNMKPANGAYHALGGGIYSIDPCAVTYTVTN